ncbi:Hsp20/alpha crystallin family protein [Maribacter polysiphoniae]|jgi:HSP20 family protein|uniref:HSP20 family protein n=1 Tax=Maribacter polysiphoniae TaxID=429344 RepID=A0A316E7Y3_9FLAO|nr:Hsp20/alpha crystallin family protein [Maribacter polysiphoniae]MBD1260192.1 Hsp20/alpha crystallin family protein [Maribacter polysiphoniae]PWK25652.1 HSP20 family protein [Maribacter polysiphoniae]
MSNLVTAGNGSLAKTNTSGLTYPTWSAWIDEMFNRDLPSIFTSNFNTGITLPKVNIRETKDAYYVDMAVPGMKKTDFHIDLDNKVLSISKEVHEDNKESKGNMGDEENYTRREFGYATFKRSFSLPETIKEENIKAEYVDGILSIHLPKKEEAIQKPPRIIEIK